jgi:hypothetical protein
MQSLLIRKRKAPTEEDGSKDSNNNSLNSSNHSGSDVEFTEPFIRFTLVQDLSKASDTVVYKYCACRVLAFYVRIDSASLQFLWYDLISELRFVSKDAAEAAAEPVKWAAAYSRDLLFPGNKQRQLADIFEARQISRASRMYFETLIIHPLKIIFTFVQTPFPRTVRLTLRSTVMNVLTAFAGVEGMELKLKSFEVDDALESTKSLTSHVVNSAIEDIRSQMVNIGFSLTVIGSPASFYRNVGSGVKSFFYEPYQGAVQSPNDVFAGFGKGMRKGSSHLFKEVVSGAMTSTIGLVGTASKGISYLSGDAEFVRKREAKRLRRVNETTIIGSLSTGGQSVASGFASGVSGLVKRPVEGAITGGFSGFLHGIGMGLVGAAVKPLLGFADGVTSVASGIQNKVNKGLKVDRRRPARAFERSGNDDEDISSANRIVVPLNLESALAQDSIVERARGKGYTDNFISYLSTVAPDADSGEAASSHEDYIIVSELYLFWRSGRKLWGRMWSNISHVVLMDNHRVGVCLYFSSGDRQYQVTPIQCDSSVTAFRLYSILVGNKKLMGNPAIVLPVEYYNITKSAGKGGNSNMTSNGGLTNSSSSANNTQSHDILACFEPLAEDHFNRVICTGNGISLNGELDGYLFGSANGIKLREITGSAEDVIRRAEANLAKPIPLSVGQATPANSSSQPATNSVPPATKWRVLDERVWVVIWEWLCTHHGLNTARCNATVLINKSQSPFQINRMRMLYGKCVHLLGSLEHTGFDPSTRLLYPGGVVVVLCIAYAPSPIEVGHLKVLLKCSHGCKITIASTQSESSVEAGGGGKFELSLLEKTVSEIWSKYVIVISSNWIARE